LSLARTSLTRSIRAVRSCISMAVSVLMTPAPADCTNPRVTRFAEIMTAIVLTDWRMKFTRFRFFKEPVVADRVDRRLVWSPIGSPDYLETFRRMPDENPVTFSRGRAVVQIPRASVLRCRPAAL
jgi:hypothetical protein